MSEACFTAADILLPAAGVPLDPWACIAVDQFTSQPEYWQRAEHLADGKPSTLHIVLPEAYLGTPQEAERLESIRRTMEEYRKTVLTRKVHGYVYVERTQMDGTVRQGLVGAVSRGGHCPYSARCVPGHPDLQIQACHRSFIRFMFPLPHCQKQNCPCTELLLCKGR